MSRLLILVQLIEKAGRVIEILAAAFLVWITLRGLEPFAGEETVLDVPTIGLAGSLLINLVLGLSWRQQRAKNRGQSEILHALEIKVGLGSADDLS